MSLKSDRAAISFQQTWNEQVELTSPLATYRFGGLPKACVHPLTTPRGHCLTGFEMSDHVWHRGLWFTIKFVNGTNYWEEQSTFGVQISAKEPRCELLSESAMRLTHQVDWTAEATGVVFNEQRSLTFRRSADGVNAIDWTTQLRAAADLTLDRTPYTTWGGYGGLSYRASREVHDVNFVLPNGETVPALAGQKHDWVVMQGSVDGGSGGKISLGMVDHPTNPRTPSPWYCKSGNGFNYMNAAFLFHEAMPLPRGESLKFRYRIFYRDGLWTAGEFADLAKAFRGEEDK
jgi:hypothetical protein